VDGGRTRIDKVETREMEERAQCEIDVAKETLAACLLRGRGKPQHREFENNGRGHGKLMSWAKELAGEAGVHYCLEATGVYGQALARHLAEAGELVSVVNPQRVKSYGMSQGALNKTDKADAKVIAEYCRASRPEAWVPAGPEVKALTAMMRRLEDLEEQRQRERARLSEPGLEAVVRRSLRRMLEVTTAEIKRLKKEVAAHIDQHPGLKADKELLKSIPGIGDLTAHWILAELPEVSGFAAAQSAAAYVGLNPQEHRSGTSVRRRARMSKAGNRHLRRALYMPAIVAKRVNPLVRALYDRLVAKGRPRMVAIGAAMRKLLMIAFGVLRSRTAFAAP
jgi:transposase